MLQSDNLIGIRFKCQGKDQIYTISDIIDYEVKISWIVDNESVSTHYLIKDVIRYLNNGDWIDTKLERKSKLDNINKIANESNL